MKPTTCFVFTFALQQIIICARLLSQVGQPASATQIVDQMLGAEEAVWRDRQPFLYWNEERSNRTGGRLWGELVIETPDGSMQRLVSEDRKPLPSDRRIVEDRRITDLISHPGEFRRKNRRRKEDEARMPELLRKIPKIFIFNNLHFQGDFAHVSFQPNPSFHEENYEDRIVHSMGGELIIHQPDMRLCELHAHLEHKVNFGFGILGVLSDDTTLSFAREKVSTGQWTTTKLHFHLGGSMLLLKNISQTLDSSRSAFRPVAHDLKAAEAADIILSNPF